MATAEEKEADEAFAAFQVALIYLGIQALQESEEDWQAVPPVRGATGGTWLKAAVRKVLNRSRLARDLAFSYYRLDRALRTGETIRTPYHPDARVSLDDLRSDFRKQVLEHVPPTRPDIPKPDRDIASSVRASSPGGKKQLRAVTIPGLTSEWISQVEKDVEDEATTVLKALGPDGMSRQIARGESDLRKLAENQSNARRVAAKRKQAENLRRQAREEAEKAAKEETPPAAPTPIRRPTAQDDTPASTVEEVRKREHAKAGARVAAASDRIAKNGARSFLYEVGKADKKSIGWVRVSRTGTPCGFCAMLISRGLVFGKSKNGSYKNKKRAEVGPGVTIRDGEEFDAFHDNCNCIALPVFSESHWKSSEAFALNREYADLWPKVTKGYGGRDALNAWRRYIERLNRESDEETKSAQEADAA